MTRQPRFDPSDDLLDTDPAATLDLHGHSVDDATRAVAAFLRTWRSRAPGAVVHVITGKGRNSPQGSALRPLVARLLKTELRGVVREWARDVDEGGFVIRLA
jgi:DNA-nicking Smr family endonuclease